MAWDDYLLASSAELKNAQSCTCDSAACLLSMHRDHFVFYFFNSIPKALHIFCAQFSGVTGNYIFTGLGCLQCRLVVRY